MQTEPISKITNEKKDKALKLGTLIFGNKLDIKIAVAKKSIKNQFAMHTFFGGQTRSIVQSRLQITMCKKFNYLQTYILSHIVLNKLRH